MHFCGDRRFFKQSKTKANQLIDTAARLLDGDLDRFRQTARISKSEKANRDLLVLFMWSTGLMTNEEIGAFKM